MRRPAREDTATINSIGYLVGFAGPAMIGWVKDQTGSFAGDVYEVQNKYRAGIQRMALAAFRSIDCAGMARVDFLLSRRDGAIFVNEVNTIPGFTTISMYPKMWEASGIPYPKLIDRLIQLALARRIG